MNQSEILISFHGDFLFWKTNSGYEIVTRETSTHVYELGPMNGQHATLGAGYHYLKDTLPTQNEIALSDRAMFILKGGVLRRELVRTTISVPNPKAIYYEDPTIMRAHQLPWADQRDVGETYQITPHLSVVRPCFVAGTVVFAYDQAFSDRAITLVLPNGILEIPAPGAFRFAAGGTHQESAVHTAQQGNKLAQLAGLPLGARLFDETAPMPTVPRDLTETLCTRLNPLPRIPPTMASILQHPIRRQQSLREFELLLSFHRANKLKSAPGFKQLEKRLKAADRERPGIASFLKAIDSGPGGNVPIGNQPNEGLATCAPMGGDDRGGGG